MAESWGLEILRCGIDVGAVSRCRPTSSIENIAKAALLSRRHDGDSDDSVDESDRVR